MQRFPEGLPPLSLYIHLPWCEKKCPYCDFNSHALAAQALPADRYLDALLRDLEAALANIWQRPVVSVFIGGGTPSLFSVRQIDGLLSKLRALLPITVDAEITIEANPGSFEVAKFQGFRDAGINRISIGVQSFNDALLQKLGRIHSAQQAKAAIESAANIFPQFNIDLMYALPGQSLEAFACDLAQALAFAPPHLSVYQLTLEPNTFFARYPPQLPDQDEVAQMQDLLLAEAAAHGLQRYEVSAFAKVGKQCRHNLNYWEFGDYLGIGAGAHGKISTQHGITREVRVRNPDLYMEASCAPIAELTYVQAQSLVFEFMLNALRLEQGFAEPLFYQRTGLLLSTIQKPLRIAQEKGLLEMSGGRIKATERGFNFLNDLQVLFLP